MHCRLAAIFQQFDVLFFDSGDVNIFDDILRQRPGFTGGVDVDGRNTALRVEAAAQGAAAVNNGEANFAFRRFTFFKSINRLPAGQAGERIDDRRAGACGDIDNLFALNDVELKRAAPTAGSFFNTNTGHDVAPDRCTFWSS